MRFLCKEILKKKANRQKAGYDLALGPDKSDLSSRLKEHRNLSLNSRIENKGSRRC